MAKDLKENKIPQAGTSEPHEIVNYDPIGSHIIELRRYYVYLEEQLEVKEENALKFEKQFRTRGGNKKSKIINLPELTIFPLPAFPRNYPFSQSFQNKPRKPGLIIKYHGDAPKALIEEKRKICIKRLIEQAGFTEIKDESMILNLLSNILEEYLQKFAITLSRNKRSEPFSKDKHLWNALESTLRDFGIQGISGLHVFYYENVVKKHDALQRKCIQMLEEVMKP